MAYRRRSSARTTAKGRYVRKIRSSARKPRSYARKTRYVRRRPTMSRKRVLNISSEKKRDKMLTYTNVSASAQTGSTTYLSTPAIITGGTSTPFVAVWCSTARDNMANTSGAKGTKFDMASRTATNCYMVGLKESIEVQVADGLPWQWRRVCFTVKGGQTLGGNAPAASTSYAPSLETSAGYVRVINGITQSQQNNLFALLFQGALNADWADPLTAKVDTERVSLKYDKVCTIASGNEQGTIRKYNRWHPMRKTLMYDDDETGGQTGGVGYSVGSRVGMGDYWVIDIIKPRTGSGTGNQLLFNCESTLYWHER